MRALSTVLLRRTAFNPTDDTKSAWPLASAQTQNFVKTELLTALQSEAIPSVRKKVADTIADLAKYISKSGDWSELFPAIFDLTRSQISEHRESALNIFNALAGEVLALDLPRYMTVLKEVFQRTLQDPQSLKVRVAALKAVVSVITVASERDQANLSSLSGDILQVFGQGLQAQDPDTEIAVLGALIDLCEEAPTFLRRHFSEIVHAMVQVVQSESREDTTRQAALELLVTFAEKAPGMVKKQAEFANLAIPAAISLMVDHPEEDEDWHTTDEIEEDDNDSNPVVGEQVMDRLACALGGKTMLPASFAVVTQLLQSPDWRRRHAALMTISCIGEGCMKTMQKELGKIVALVAPFLKDPHARVRYAACNALGQMSTDFKPVMQTKYNAIIVPALMEAMSDVQNPRVQAHAAAAMVNFSEGATKDALAPYLDAMLEKLLCLLQTGKRYVQEQAITTIASIADSAQEHFIRYYDTFVPLLKNIIMQANDRQFRLLRGKAMECVSLIGLAVGKEKFLPDAHFIMNLMRRVQDACESDDPQTSYMLAAWARICKVLGPDFIEYLPVVMPPLLRSAQLKADLAVVDPNDEAAMENYDPAEGWEFVTVDDQVCGNMSYYLQVLSTF